MFYVYIIGFMVEVQNGASNLNDTKVPQYVLPAERLRVLILIFFMTSAFPFTS